MNRFGQMLFGLVAAFLIMGGVYLIYLAVGGPEAQQARQDKVDRELDEQEALITLQSWWDGNGENGWNHEASLDSFGVKRAQGNGVDSLVLKGRLADTVRVLTVPVTNTRWQRH